MEITENQEFKDISNTGKDRKWKERKLQNIEYAKRLEILGYKAFANAYQCAEVLKFKELEGRLRLHQAWFCKSKLCPICNWRRSMKYGVQLGQIIDVVREREPKAKFIFLTLTVKNVSGEKLGEELTNLTKSFDRLFRRAKVKKSVIGYLRAIEVTYTAERDDYHPHIHVMLMVKASYFKKSEYYISQEEWTEMWEQSAKLDYTPIVDVRKVKPHKKKAKDEMDLRGAIIETAKYPTKPIEKMGKTEEQKLKVTDDLYKALYRKRQIGFGGLFKEIRKELQLEDVENGDLIHVDEDNDDVSLGTEIVAVWNWERMNYYVAE
ncbi:protein rep [Enterococcus avium]|uniref:protein rep n=1 Tax=Enterococcus avium TaxID=33945 RepID=UPI00288D5EAA|nr:protein rep [Enterococcus avium]MDT2550918.1 protein rep [Enterococcus avium]